MKIQYRLIYDICQKPDAKVQEIYKGGEWYIQLRRCLHGATLDEWNELQEVLQNMNLNEQGRDVVSWALEKSKTFTTRSLYNCLTHGGVKDKLNAILWKCKIPLKVKVFLWQVFHNKLQTALSLTKRGWQGSPCVVWAVTL